MSLHWDDTRIFLAIARTGTLTSAAQQLGMGIATLSRRVERLEQALGIALFIRSQLGYQLTEEGQTLVGYAERMETAMLGFAKSTFETRIVGTVRIATAENLATQLVLPHLPMLTQQHPDLSIELVTDIRTANLHRHDADVALRMTKPSQGNVSFRRVGTLGYGLYGADSASPAKLHATQTIGWDTHYRDLPAAQYLQQQLHGEKPALTTTSIATQLSACKAGLGIAVLPHIVAAEDDAVHCLQALPELNQDIYLVVHSDLSHSKRVRCVADFLAELVQRHQQALAHAT